MINVLSVTVPAAQNYTCPRYRGPPAKAEVYGPSQANLVAQCISQSTVTPEAGDQSQFNEV